VSKDFDSTLSDALDLAARAARTAGPEAARIRGRKRTVHQRIALSTAAFVVVAVGATTAFAVASSGGGHTPRLTGGSPHVSTSASPTTGPTTSPSAGTTTGTTASNSASQAASSTTASSPASSQSAVADPHQVVAAAWLSPDQMPFAGTFSWKAIEATQNTAPLGEQLTPTVFYVPNNENFQALTVCADPAKLLPRTTGAQHTEYSATSGTVASQFIFFFADNASAQQTYTWLQSQYSSACLGSFSTVQVSKTGGDGATSAAWLTVKTSKSGPVDLSPYNREYFVLRGSTIAYVEIESTATLPTTYDDAAQISTIASHLCVYGGSCY
jgi:hypothetical protein